MDSMYNAGNFVGKPFDDKSSGIIKNPNVEKIIKGLRRNGVLVDDEEFAKKLLTSYLASISSTREIIPIDMERVYISNAAVNSIVAVAKRWKLYLQNPEDFERLIRTEIVSMLVCHTSVFSTYFCEKNGFKLVEEKPGPTYATIINRAGKVEEVR